MTYPEGYLQKVILYVGIGLIILMLLFPPWIEIIHGDRGGTYYGDFLCYRFIFNLSPLQRECWTFVEGPDGRPKRVRDVETIKMRIDLSRLIIQILPIVILLAIVIWTAGSIPKNKKKE